VHLVSVVSNIAYRRRFDYAYQSFTQSCRSNDSINRLCCQAGHFLRRFMQIRISSSGDDYSMILLESDL